MVFQPQTQTPLRTHNTRFPRIFALGIAVALAGQLVWTTTKGYVYCGHFAVIRRVDDRLMYRTYCLIHLLSVAGFAVFGFGLLR